MSMMVNSHRFGVAVTGLQYVGGKISTITTVGSESVGLTDLTGGLSAAPSAGDLVIVGYVVASAAGERNTMVTTRNFRRLGQIRSPDSRLTFMVVFAAYMDSTPAAAFSVNGLATSDDSGLVAIEVWRGVDSKNWLDVAAQLAFGGNTGQPDCASITPVTVGAKIIAVGGSACASPGSAFTSGNLSTFNSMLNAGGAVTDCVIGMGHSDWTSGAFDPAQFGGGTTATADSWAGATLALKPGTNAKFAGPISFVGSKTFTFTADVGGTVSLADLLDSSGATATLAEGDIVIVNTSVAFSGTGLAQRLLMPANFTPVHLPLYANDSGDTGAQVCFRFMGPTPDASFSVPIAGSSGETITGTVHALRGVDILSPIDVDATTAIGTNSGIPDPASITPATAGSWIMIFGNAANLGGMSGLTAPSGLSGTTNHFRSVAATNTFSGAAAAGLKTDWTSGAFDAGVFGGGSASSSASWAAAALVLRPAP